MSPSYYWYNRLPFAYSGTHKTGEYEDNGLAILHVFDVVLKKLVSPYALC